MLRYLGKEEPCSKLKINSDIELIEINLEKISFSMFSNLKCVNCGMYKRNFHCVPLNYIKGKAVLKEYKNIYLIIIKKSLNDRIEEMRDRFKAQYSLYRMVCGMVVMPMKKEMNIFLQSLNRFLKIKNEKNIIYGYGGGCTGCRDCNLHNGGKCKKPNSYFRAPESTGIDVYKTLDNINYDYQIIPREKVILVGLLASNLSKEEIIENEE